MEEPKGIPGFSKYLIDSNGFVYSTMGKHIRLKKPYTSGSGYVGIKLTISQAKTVAKLVHRLVWETYVGPIPRGHEINHKNGNKKDNSLSNLELLTHSENLNHAYKTLGVKAAKGEQSGMSKLNEVQVKEIKVLLASKVNQSKIAKLFNVSQVNINYIARGITWRESPKERE